jgi:RNA polymerase sigma factor (sigma-70 family)
LNAEQFESWVAVVNRLSLRNNPSVRRQESAVESIVATDGELLMRFLRYNDQQAFADVVERHGGLVWLVCREVLRQHQDVEDAFQATFLILAQRAWGIRSGDSVGAWLFKVAQRTAIAARRKRARQREESLVGEPPVGEEALPLLHDRQMRFILLDELRAMPVRYQTPLVLRYLEGQSRRSIAEQTDSTVSQVQGRLARGRRMLRSRLVRRGVSLSLAAGGISMASGSASAAVTPALVSATAKSCLMLKVTGAAAGTSAVALELAKEGMKAMWCASMIKACAVAGVLLISAGIGWAAQQGTGDASKSSSASRVALQATADTPEKPDATAIAVGDSNAKSEVESEPNEDALLAKAINQNRDLAERLTRERVEETTKLELQRLAKSLTQREVESVHGLLMELELQSLRSGDSLTEEQVRQGEERKKALDRKLEEVTEELESVTHRTARTQSEVEALDIELARVRQVLNDLQREQTLPRPVSVDESARPMSIEGEDIGPHDVIRIQVSNALAEAPIRDTYPVESMGTVALGPEYGRVKVAGLSVLEAEEAVRQHLAKSIEDPQVQVTMFEKGDVLIDAVGGPRTAEDPALAASTFRAAPFAEQPFQKAIAAELERLHRKVNALEVEHTEPRGEAPGGLFEDRLKHRVPIEIGHTETGEGVRIEIDEVRGTRPKIEVGGHYLVRGRCILPPGKRGRLYFWLTKTTNIANAPTANTDLQSAMVDSEHGEFTLMNSMQGPGRFHLKLMSADDPSEALANMYFGTDETEQKE